MNPMMASLGNGQASGLKNILNVMGACRNPAGVLNNTVIEKLKQHPLYAQAEQIAAQYGGDWNRTFEETEKANGVDPGQIVGIMKQNNFV